MGLFLSKENNISSVFYAIQFLTEIYRSIKNIFLKNLPIKWFLFI